jgi:hypothetical protein
MTFKELAPTIRKETRPFSREFGVFDCIKEAAAQNGVILEGVDDLSHKLLIAPWDVESMFNMEHFSSPQTLADFAERF